MQRRYVLALGLIAAMGLLSAQPGPACPYAHRDRIVTQSDDPAPLMDDAAGGGSFLGLGRSAIFAP